MDLTDAKQDRLSLGIERLLAGDPITYHGVTFYISGRRTLNVDCFSDWTPEQTSEANAKALIARSKSVLEDLVGRSATLAAATRHLRQEFTVCYNYGMGSVALAKEAGGVFQWIYQG